MSEHPPRRKTTELLLSISCGLLAMWFIVRALVSFGLEGRTRPLLRSEFVPLALLPGVAMLLAVSGVGLAIKRGRRALVLAGIVSSAIFVISWYMLDWAFGFAVYPF